MATLCPAHTGSSLTTDAACFRSQFTIPPWTEPEIQKTNGLPPIPKEHSDKRAPLLGAFEHCHQQLSSSKSAVQPLGGIVTDCLKGHAQPKHSPRGVLALQ